MMRTIVVLKKISTVRLRVSTMMAIVLIPYMKQTEMTVSYVHMFTHWNINTFHPHFLKWGSF